MYICHVLRYVWVIDQACSVKMAGYWPSSFFCVSMDRDGVEVHKLEKKRRPISSHFDRTSLVIKGLLYGFRAFGPQYGQDKACSVSHTFINLSYVGVSEVTPYVYHDLFLFLLFVKVS